MPPKKKQNKNISLPVNEPTINPLPEPEIQSNNTLDRFFQLDNPATFNSIANIDIINDNYIDNYNYIDNKDGNLFPEDITNQNNNQNNNQINNQNQYNKNENITPLRDIGDNVINYNYRPENIYYSLSDIKKKIELLSEDQQIEIFRIIKNNSEKYSVNKNGIFINISTVKKNTIKDITNLIYFSENNNKFIDAEEHNRNMYREYITN